MPPDDSHQLKILAVAIGESIVDLVQSYTSDLPVQTIDSQNAFDDQYENFTDGMFALIICGSKLGKEFSQEAAQVLKCQCPTTPSFFITEERENFRAQDLQKNGFTKAFLYPADKESLKSSIISSVNPDVLKERHFKPVRIVDLGENEVLGFETHVYLPLNKKFVRYSQASEMLSSKKIEKLEQHHIGAVHIDHKDAKIFYEYTARRLKALGQNDQISETEKQERLKDSISGLFSDIFDVSKKDTYDTGKSLFSSCQKIVSCYISNGRNDNWYANLVKTIGSERGNFNHASEVSTFASLFAIGLQHPNPEDLALAGFLHDLALAEFPDDLLLQPKSSWPKEYQVMYNEHPRESVNMIKRKKMIINESIERAILEHHEMFNGQGFPKQRSGDMISHEAQILSFADQFQYLMTVVEGQKRLSPIEAFSLIEKNKSISPKLLQQIKPLLMPSK